MKIERNERYAGKKIIPDEGNYFVSYVEENFERHEPETALVGREGYFILLGDWLVDYEKIIDKGWDACFNFYRGQPEFHSPLSDDYEIKPSDDDAVLYQLQTVSHFTKNLED